MQDALLLLRLILNEIINGQLIHAAKTNWTEHVTEYKYIEANPVKKIPLNTLGSALHTDTEVLRIFFAENLRCKLPEYLRKKKIAAAKRLLAETDLSLPEVCEKVGLTEEQLTRLIVKSESVTPEQFRQNHRK